METGICLDSPGSLQDIPVKREANRADPDETIRTGAASSGPARNQPVLNSDLTEGYKCDYCDMASDSEAAVLIHMQDNLHNSASLVYMDASMTPVYVKKPVDLTLKTEKRAVMASCPFPDCDKMFMSTYMCSEHFNVCHQSDAVPMYGLAEVEEQETLLYKRNKGEGHFFLPKHEADRAMQKSPTMYKCFICSICQSTFSHHEEVIAHLGSHWPKKIKNFNSATVAVSLLWVIKQSVRHTMLRFTKDKQGQLDCIKEQLKNLQCLKNTAENRAKHTIVKKIKKLQHQVTGLQKTLKKLRK